MNAWNRAEPSQLLRFLPPFIDFCQVCSQRAGGVFEWAIAQLIVRDSPWYYVKQLCMCALALACILTAATCCVRQRASCSRSLNILKASMSMVLSQSSRLLFLASHRMELTREHKIPSRFSREIHIFSTFAWSVPMLVPKHNSRFSSFLQHTLLVMMID